MAKKRKPSKKLLEHFLLVADNVIANGGMLVLSGQSEVKAGHGLSCLDSSNVTTCSKPVAVDAR